MKKRSLVFLEPHPVPLVNFALDLAFLRTQASFVRIVVFVKSDDIVREPLDAKVIYSSDSNRPYESTDYGRRLASQGPKVAIRSCPKKSNIDARTASITHFVIVCCLSVISLMVSLNTAAGT